jgi:hypothetical protein
MSDGGVVGGSARQSGEQGGLGKSEFEGRFAEVILRAGLKAVDALTEVDLIGVEGEDLVLGEVALDLDGEQDLLQLAAEGAFGGQEQVFCQLHR